MESKKSIPATQQPLQQQHMMPHHVHPTSNHQNHLHLHNHNPAPVTNRLNSPQPYQIQPNGIVHQLLMQNPSTYQTNLQQMSNSSSDARSPLLQNQQELYGTRQPIDYNRQYGANDNYPYTQKLETRAEHIQPSNHNAQQSNHNIQQSNHNIQLSNHNINQDIMHAIPKGYNAEVYQDYMKRNPPKETNQIYQNHQTYQPNISQYTNKPYLPYTNRIQPPTQSNTELLRRQYTEIQQMKLQQQMHYQNQAQMQQQQTFAERQLLLQQMHGIQPAPNLQQNIYSDGYKDSDRYKMMSQQSEKDDRYKPQSPNSEDSQTQPHVNPNTGPMSPMKSSGESNSPSVKSPASSESRRSSGGNQVLRSPVAQRPASAPVTMSGILYKQGSDGLKVWRKRWFVLSEYCLFYYKSEEEGKLLGSVLLPSYCVSACGPEERALRKFAFKLAHVNMRTYVLAAPDHQQMVRWVKALTAAATMQDTPRVSEQQKQTERKQTASQENEEEDEVPGPTYANAPPKPRRSNDGYNSPGSDIYDPNYDLLQKPASHYSQSNQNRYTETNHPTTTTIAENSFDRNPQSQQYDHYATKRSYDPQILSLPLTNTAPDRLENQNPRSMQYRNDSQPSLYENRARSHQQQQRQQEQKLNDEILAEQIYGRNQTQNLIYSKEKSQEIDPQSRYRTSEEITNKNDIPQTDNQANFDPNIYSRENYDKITKVSKTASSDRLPIERRTPDAYGRSTVISYNRAKTSDYEDVYPAYNSGENEYGMSYSKPANPSSFAEKKTVPAMPGYPATNYAAKYSSNHTQGFNGPSVLRRKKMQSSNPTPNVQRPHSADFLEYESKQELNKTMPSRTVCEPAKQPQRPKSSLDINSYYDPSSDRYYSEESYAEKMRQSAQYLQQRGLSTKDFQVPLAKYTSGLAQKQLDSYTQNLNNNYESGYDAPKDNVSYNSKYSDLEALNSNWTLKEKTQKDLTRTGSAMSDGSNMSTSVRENAQRNDTQSQDSFMRSASARLPSAATEGNDGVRKVQQREESMKRLLEWKQRMLQSPLTRKSTPASISLARSLNQSRQAAQNRALDQYKQKSSTYTNNSYNSYSSDDEASVSISGAGMGPNAVTNQAALAKKAFLGSNTSIGRSNRDNNIPVRAVSPRVRWTEEKPSGGTYGSQQISISQQNLSTINMAEDSWATARSPSRMSQQPIRAVSPRVRRHTDSDDRSELRDVPPPTQNTSVLPAASVEQLMSDNLTAGELLGRTHEELVLLLIQLRRRHAATHQAMEQCAAKMNSIKDCLSSLTALERQESLQRLEQLKHQLMELEQQYEKSKPLVHLVDNMVKLGSLYNRPAGSSTIDKLERNQRLRQKVLAEQAEEQRRWAEGKVGDPDAARARVEELWALERELATEAATLHGLKADKEAIETLLTGVRSKFGALHLSQEPAAASPRGPAGQEALEADLARVHAMLAHNSKKLEQTVADNARLERELLSLRRALHTHRQTPATHAPSHTPTTALLEDEVARVQQLVSALQRQRQELSRAVRHLTHQSRALHTGNAQPPPEQPLYAPGSVKRHTQTSWLETDIDSGHCIEHGLEDYDYDSSVSMTTSQYDTDVLNMQPLYVDTLGEAPDAMSPLTSDDITGNGLTNLTNVEKQEIKTVRIVKRESERRQRDRDRSIQPNTDWNSSNISVDLDHLLEEEFTPHYTNRSTSLPRTQQYTQDYYSKSRNQPPNYLRLSNVNVPEINSMELSPKFPSSPSLSNYDYSRDLSSSYNRSYDYSHGLSMSSQFLNSPTDSNRTLTNDPLSKTSSIGSLTRNAELSPIFKSEAAKQIITEMSGDGPTKNSSSIHRRQVPKEKRRHYTAPHHLSAKTLSEMPSEYFNQEKMGRSLDDADMERALRAPPDVVRSALAPQRYAENTIDQLLLAPRKIVIPERYIPEKPPELSPEEQKKRLEKVESIKKMLSSSNGSDPSKSPDGEEKRQRDHLLQMNQILARQVMEMSKIVAGTNPDPPGSSASHN